MPSQYYRGAIWTNHALSRLKERGITQDLAGSVFANPEKSFPGRKPGTFQYQKKVDKTLITIVATQNEKSEWIILSVWVDPPLPGSVDDKRRKAFLSYQNAPFWKKILITAFRQIGLRKY